MNAGWSVNFNVLTTLNVFPAECNLMSFVHFRVLYSCCFLQFLNLPMNLCYKQQESTVALCTFSQENELPA